MSSSRRPFTANDLNRCMRLAVENTPEQLQAMLAEDDRRWKVYGRIMGPAFLLGLGIFFGAFLFTSLEDRHSDGFIFILLSPFLVWVLGNEIAERVSSVERGPDGDDIELAIELQRQSTALDSELSRLLPR